MSLDPYVNKRLRDQAQAEADPIPPLNLSFPYRMEVFDIFFFELDQPALRPMVVDKSAET